MANFTPDENMKQIDQQEELIIDNLGTAGALEAITRAMSYDDKKEIYDYIIRVYDIETED